jgi:hypothetical protein
MNTKLLIVAEIGRPGEDGLGNSQQSDEALLADLAAGKAP